MVEISPRRKSLHEFGATLQMLGALSAVGGIITFIVGLLMIAGDACRMKGIDVPWPLLGLGFVVLGGVLATVGTVIKKTAAKGMLRDALDAAQLSPPPVAAAPATPQVKLRCRPCGALNDEQAKFCSQCGKPL